MPRVSIIMAVYNCENFLVLSVESILKQTYKDFEFIICDDASTDRSYQILKEYAIMDKRIMLLSNIENMGLRGSLNRCLDYSNGEYIARQDADDYSHIHRIMKQVDFLDQHSNLSFISCNTFVFNEKGIWGQRKQKEYPEKFDFLWGTPFVHPATLFRKSALDAVSNYRIAMETNRVEDYDLYMRMYSKGIYGYNYQEALYFYREDQMAYKKRKYRFRINEAIVRYKGYVELKLMPVGLIFVLKPLLVGLIPSNLMSALRHMLDKR